MANALAPANRNSLLAALMSAADSSKRYIKDLVRNPRDVLDAWADRNVQAYTKPNVQDMAGNYMGAGVMPGGLLGKIVWHGSPHKFDKFDMSKIGTGEGAQAYGHGLYMAEAPETAQMYRASVAAEKGKSFGLEDGPTKGIATLIAAKGKQGEEMARHAYANLGDDLEKTIAAAKQAVEGNSQLYKVDIPDEAVARMLDWDKPLSEQAPEVQNLLSDLIPKIEPWEQRLLDTGKYHSERAFQASMPGSTLLNKINETELKARGIPGIRYLDQVSRGAGKGTSNFVLFDDQLARILERNNVPTGNQPWQPGEYNALARMVR